jgi:hypothetical protein
MESSSDEGGTFIVDPETGCFGDLPDGVLAHCTECDFWNQDCPEGEACKPWANDGGDSWNAARCSPIDPDAGQLGDPCQVEGSAVSGFDSCDVGLMCWAVDADTLEGTCVQHCAGTEFEPECANPDEACNIANDGYLPLCLPVCDPLAPTCGAGFGCYPGSHDFVCLPEGARVEVDHAVHPECPPGSFMAPADLIEGCIDDQPCCTTFCEVGELDACGAGAECLPYFERPLPEIDLGYCSAALPASP